MIPSAGQAIQMQAPLSPGWPDGTGAMTNGHERSRGEATRVSITDEHWRKPPMRCTVMLMMLCAALATPMVASGGDQAIPPEAQWTPTPPARSTAEGKLLASMLVDTGMIAQPKSTQLTASQASSPALYSRARAWTWEEIDHHRVRSSAGD
jgi:hypothetical protein